MTRRAANRPLDDKTSVAGGSPELRVSPNTVKVTPGTPFVISVSLVNTTAVIDAFEVAVLGVDGHSVTVEPGLVSLFPDAAGTLTVQITLPSDFPAGPCDTWIKARSCTDKSVQSLAPLHLDVAESKSAKIDIDPTSAVGRRSGRFGVTVTNDGNTPLSFALLGSDEENHFSFAFEPPRLDLPASESASVQVEVSGKRSFTGAATPRQFKITAESPGLKLETSGSLAQRPYISRFVLMIGFVVALLALWAIVVGGAIDSVIDDTNTGVAKSFKDGVGAVVDGISSQPSAQSELAAARDAATAAASGQANAADGSAGSGVNVSEAAPTTTPAGPAVAGSSGPVVAVSAATTDAPTTLGGAPAPVAVDELSGAVLSAADDLPIAGATLTIQPLLKPGGALDPNRQPTVAVADANGNFQLSQIIPGSYSAMFAAAGFVDVSCPSVDIPSPAGAAVATCFSNEGASARVKAGEPSTVKLVGRQSSIAGIVTANGAPLAGATVTMSRLDRTTGTPAPIAGLAAVIVADDGHFSFVIEPNTKATPGAFEVLAVAEGYVPQRSVVTLAAGQNVIGIDVPMSAAQSLVVVGTNASIAGVVTANGAPLSGAVVGISRLDSTTGTPSAVRGLPDVVVTDSGRFSFVIDPSTQVTPGQFEIDVSAPDFFPQRKVVPLATGQNVVGLEIPMTAAPPPTTTTPPTTTAPPVVRQISGTVVRQFVPPQIPPPEPVPLENVRVTITGASGSHVVFTLANGTYVLDGLAPGLYNVFFELPPLFVSKAITVDMRNGDGTGNVGLVFLD